MDAIKRITIQTKSVMPLVNIISLCFFIYKLQTLQTSIQAKFHSLRNSTVQNSKITAEKLDSISLNTNKSQQVLLEHIQKSEKIIADLAKLDSVMSDLKMDSERAVGLLGHPHFDYVTKSPEITFKGILIGCVIGLICAVLVYSYVNNPLKGLKADVLECIQRLPGSGCAEGTQHLDNLGLVIRTTIINGKASSFYTHTLTGKNYTSFLDFLQQSNMYDITLVDKVTSITTMTSSTGIDLSGII